MLTPEQQLNTLGVIAPKSNIHSLTPTDLEQMRNRASGFNWVHLGQTNVTVGQLREFLLANDQILPPRTGHLGNWQDINHYSAGAMDFNYPSSRNGLGYGLIYCFNQTENHDLTTGDYVYLPGSIVENGKRTPLPLYAWNGTEFAGLSRDLSYFTPFIQTKVKQEWVPLTQLHLGRLKASSNLFFRSEASLIYQNWEKIGGVIQDLFQAAFESKNPRAEFQELIGHVVTLDGKVERARIEVTQSEGAGRRLSISGLPFSSIEELAELTRIPFMAVGDSDRFFESIKTFPKSVPIISNTLTRILSALCNSHYPKSPVDSSMTTPFNPHYHWGARAMSGYPPVRKGYFSNKNKKRYTSKFCNRIVAQNPEIDPLLFLLLPTSAFMLQASTQFPGDEKLIDGLLSRVSNATADLGLQPELMIGVVQDCVDQWMSAHMDDLSGYFVGRFLPKQGILPSSNLQQNSCASFQDGTDHTQQYAPIESTHFGDLTLQQACMTIGCLHNTLSKTSV